MKGKGGEWEERTDGIMQILRTICLKCASLYSSSFIPISFSWCRRRKPLLHDSTANDTSRPTPIRAPCPICTSSPFPRRRPRQHCSTSAQPIPIRPQAKYTRPRPYRRAGWLGQLGKNCGVTRWFRCESMGRGMGTRFIFGCRNRHGQHRRRSKNVRVPRAGPRPQSTLLFLVFLSHEH